MTNFNLKALAAAALLGGTLVASLSVQAATPIVTVDGSSVPPSRAAVASAFKLKLVIIFPQW